jgi:hypothetical protein
MALNNVSNWLRKKKDELLSKTTLDERLSSGYNQLRTTMSQGVQNVKKSDWASYTPFSMKSQIVPSTMAAAEGVRRIFNTDPQKTFRVAQDIGYGLRGATNLTPFQSIKPLTPQLQAQQNLTNPTTFRQKTAQSIGQGIYGTILTSPIAGGPLRMMSNATIGTGLGVGMGVGSDLLTGKGLPNKERLTEHALTGFQNSWVLPITNTITNQLLSKIAPKLVTNTGALTQPFKEGAVKEGFKRLFLRALAESPAENTAFTFLNRLDDSSKNSFMKDWALNMPGTITTNMAFAMANGTWNTAINKQSREAVSDALKKTIRQWNTPVSVYRNGKRVQIPMWEYKMKNQPLGFGTQDINKLSPEDYAKQAGISVKEATSRLKVAQPQATKGVGGVDELKGKTFYHGTKSDFKTFEGGHLGVKADTNGGFYFSPQKKVGKAFAGDNGRIIEANIDVKNPKIAKDYKEIATLTKADIQQAIREGYDGYYFKPEPKDIKSGYYSDINEELVAFSPKQINILPQSQLVEGGATKGVGGVGKNPKNQDLFTIKVKPTAEKVLKEGRESFDKMLKDAGIKTQKPIEQSTQQEISEAFLKNEGQKGVFKNLFSKWIGERRAASLTGLETGKKYSSLPYNKGSEFIKYRENPKIKTSQDIKTLTKQFGQETDKLFKEAEKSGIDMNYQKNYITHIWKEPLSEVQQKYSVLSKKFKFSSERTLPTYEEGIKIGLTPKYTHPSQIMASYVDNLEKTKANIKFLESLQKEGLVATGPVARNTPGFMPIEAPGFPRPKGGGYFYAPEDIVNTINKVFKGEDAGVLGKVLDVTGKLAGGFQDITLAGGIPKTPLNFWTFTQVLFKELPAGRVRGPLKAVGLSMSEKASNNYFAKNSNVIKEMELNNIPVRTSYNINNIVDKGWIKNTFGESIGQAWNKFVNEPTFRRFGPISQVEFFKDVKNQAMNGNLFGLGKKLPEKEASALAAKAVKQFYGVVSSDKMAIRSKAGQDALTTGFLAARYRETILNFLGNTIKSFKKPLALENRTNVKWALGALGVYLLYDKVNYALNNKHLHENPPGTEDKLLIPIGNDMTIGVPYMSSILTLPRMGYRMARKALTGDIKGAGLELRSAASQLVKPAMEIAANEDYFGNNIYDESDTAGQRYKKIGLYLFKQYNHPYIRGIVDSLEGKKTGKQIISESLELPIRWYKDKNLEAKFYYANKDKYLKGLKPEDKSVYDSLHSGGGVDEDGLPIYNKRSDMANALLRLANPQVLQAEQAIAYQTSQDNGQMLNPFYELDPKQQEIVLTLKTFYPGDSTKSTITKSNLEWLQPYWDKRDKYVQYLKDTGVIQENDNYNGAPKASIELQKKLDYYDTLPSGTGARSAYLRANPDVLQFFTDYRNYNNAQRADLGLPLLADYGSGYGGKGKKPSLPNFKEPSLSSAPKLSVKMPSAPKIRVANVPTPAIKPLTLPKKNVILKTASSPQRQISYQPIRVRL